MVEIAERRCDEEATVTTMGLSGIEQDMFLMSAKAL